MTKFVMESEWPTPTVALLTFSKKNLLQLLCLPIASLCSLAVLLVLEIIFLANNENLLRGVLANP